MGRYCPRRCVLSMACISAAGFHHGSTSKGEEKIRLKKRTGTGCEDKVRKLYETSKKQDAYRICVLTEVEMIGNREIKCHPASLN